MDPAFTLIEVIVVVAVAAMLSGLMLGAMHGAHTRAMISRTRAELSALGEALESYRREYGDFPQTADTPQKLHGALRGRISPTGAEISGRDFLEKLPLTVSGGTESAATFVVDPWGRAYDYVFYTRTQPDASNAGGCLLYSQGPRRDSGRLPLRDEIVPQRNGIHGGEIAVRPETSAIIYARHD
ncbi:MAG: type secretion pathway protein XcpT [Verrucomicrobia bacterium]|nr:type secretion pathway protein XcpT [Verrucomicrobiota bacterium]